MRTSRPAQAMAVVASIGLLSVTAACSSSSSAGSSTAEPADQAATSAAAPASAAGSAAAEPAAASQTGGESIEACVKRLAGDAAGGEKKDVTLNVITHDKGAADWLATMGDVISGLPDSPYNYTVTQTITGPSDVTVKTQAGLASGSNVSDIIGIEIGEFGNYYAGLQDNFVDLSAVLGPLRDENAESRWASYTKDGKIYGVETTYPLSVYYYNADEFTKLGLDPNQFTTWDDLLKASSEVNAKTGQYLLAMPLDLRGATFLAQQQGGGIFDENGQPIVDAPEMQKAVELIKRGLDEKAILGFSISDFIGAPNFAAMQNKEVIGYAFPDWWLAYFMKPQIADQAGQWRAMPLPTFAGGSGTTSLSGGHGLAVYKQGPNADAATMLVVCGGATAEGQVRKFVDQGFLPTNKYAWESPEILDREDPFLGGQKLGALFASLRDQAPTFYTTSAFPAATKVLDNYLGQAYRGEIGVADALAKAQSEIKAASGQ